MKCDGHALTAWIALRQVSDGVDGVFDADDVIAQSRRGFSPAPSQIPPGQRQEVMEHHRQRDAVRHLLEIADQVRFRHFPVVGLITVPSACLLRVLAQLNGFPGVGTRCRSGPARDRST